MHTTLNSLRAEKARLVSEFVELGRQDGQDWAEGASLEDFLYFDTWEAPGDNDEDSWVQLVNDPVLGDYFGEIILDSDLMKPGQDEEDLNEFALAWFNSWYAAVDAFWREVKGKL